MSDTIRSGVNPTNEITFGVCASGRPEDLAAAEYTTVKDATAINISVEGGTETWNPMDTGGWQRALMTSKALNISMGGKRNYGDPGNDYVAGLAFKMGQDCNSAMKVTFPNGDTLYIPCVINTTSLGGESTAIEGLEWEAISDGKPQYVSYTVA